MSKPTTEQKITIKGRKGFVGTVLVGEITGGRYFWRGQPCGSYDFKPATGWTTPWTAAKKDIRGHGGWCYFDDIVKDVRSAIVAREIAPLTAVTEET